MPGKGDELRAVVGMQAGPKFFEQHRFPGGGFGQEKKLSGFFPFPFPDVMGLHGREDLDAGGGFSLQGGLSEAGGGRFGVHGGEEDGDFHAGVKGLRGPGVQVCRGFEARIVRQRE